MTMTETQLKLESARLEIEQLKAQLKQTEGAVQSQKHTAAQKHADWLAEVEAEAEVRAQAIFLQQQVLEAGKAARSKARVYTRPSTMTEYRALTRLDQSKVLGLFGGDTLIRELTEKENRENAALPNGTAATRSVLATSRTGGPALRSTHRLTSVPISFDILGFWRDCRRNHPRIGTLYSQRPTLVTSAESPPHTT